MEFSEVLNSLNLDDNAKEKEMKYFASNNDFLRMNHGTHTSMALLGYPNAGKTSLFNHLTNRKETVDSALYSTLDINVGHRAIKDDRLDWLCEVYTPKNVERQHVTIIDLPALVKGAHVGHGIGNEILQKIKKVTTIVFVLRGFDDDDLSHIDEIVDPIAEVEGLHQELLVHDLLLVEAAITKEEKVRIPSRETQLNLECLYKAWTILNGEEYGEAVTRRKHRIQRETREIQTKTKTYRSPQGLGLRHARWTSREIDALKDMGLDLLTGKQVIYLPNLSARDYCRSYDKWTPLLRRKIDAIGGGMLARISVAHETRLAKFSSKKLKEYLRSNAEQHASALDKLFHNMITSLDLLQFYVCNDDKVVSYFCRLGTVATRAAGLVHADFERNFSFLEITNYSDMQDYQGNIDELKEDGKMRSEGRKYIVNDGDIIDFGLCTEEFRKQMAKKKKGG